MSDAPSWYWDSDGSDTEESAASDLLVSESQEPSIHQRIADAIAVLEAEEREAAEVGNAPDALAGESNSASAQSNPTGSSLADLFRRGASNPRVRLALAIALIVGLAGYFAVETAGRILIERVAETQIRNGGASGQVEVIVGGSWWTPSISKLLLTNKLDRADVSLESAQLFMVPVHRVSYRLRGLEMSMSLRSRTVRVTSLSSGSVLLVIDPSSVSGFLGVDVSTRDGQLFIGDSSDPASLEVQGSELIIDSTDIVAINGTTRVAFPIVDSYLLPCSPTAKIKGSFIELRCSGSKMPGILDQAIGPTPPDNNVDKSVPPEIGPSESTILEPDGGVDTGTEAVPDGMGPDGAQGGLSTEGDLPPSTIGGGG